MQETGRPLELLVALIGDARCIGSLEIMARAGGKILSGQASAFDSYISVPKLAFERKIKHRK